MTEEEVLTSVGEIETLRQQLLQAQRLSSVGELASSIAHEFNNILTTIINSAKLGMRNPDLTEKQQAFERVVKAGQRVEYVQVGGAGHAFFDWKPDERTKATFAKYGVFYCAEMEAFFNSVFYPAR
jgi:hypothetical protein